GLWELMNGSRPEIQNRLAREIAESVGASELRQMAARLGLKTPPHRFIRGTGGSDDHGGIYGGTTCTTVPKVKSAKELLEAISSGETRVLGEDGSVDKVAHTGFKIAGGAFREGKSATGLLKRVPLKSAFLNRFRGSSNTEDKLLEYLPLLARLDGDRVKTALVGRYEDGVSGSLAGAESGFPALDFLGSIGSFIDAHAFIAPYVAVHGYFGRETRKARELRRRVFPERPEELRVGVFVDGMDSVHGVATMYRNVRALAEARDGESLRVIRCGRGEREGAVTIAPLAVLPVPLYDGLELGVPSILEVLEHVVSEDYNVLHVAAPGPLGLAALISGLILGIPVVGAYHTEFGAYARALSGDAFVAEIVEVAVREFYERCSAVAVPSGATALSLRNRGYRIERFDTMKNGVDKELFDPSRRDPTARRSLGGGKRLLLYVGRVSREKDLEALAAGYLELRRRRDDAHLVVVGDGPYREELEASLGGAATFTGFLSGEELARVFASCDVFVFPSATDTLGRAVVEAQASGVPAVVNGVGGPRECIRPGESGFVADGGEDFFEKVELLLDDEGLRRSMGEEARRFAETLGWEAALNGFIELHADLAGIERAADAGSRELGVGDGEGGSVK
ncbi:MAG: glycosyltransferase family 4 protein, partial [Rubrobacteraceae bacterium]